MENPKIEKKSGQSSKQSTSPGSSRKSVSEKEERKLHAGSSKQKESSASKIRR